VSFVPDKNNFFNYLKKMGIISNNFNLAKSNGIKYIFNRVEDYNNFSAGRVRKK